MGEFRSEVLLTACRLWFVLVSMATLDAGSPLGPGQPHPWEASIYGAGRPLLHLPLLALRIRGVDHQAFGAAVGRKRALGLFVNANKANFVARSHLVQEAHAFRFRPDDSAGMNDQRKSESGGRQGVGNQNGFVEVNHIRLPLAFEMGQRCQGERRFRGIEGSADATACPPCRWW